MVTLSEVEEDGEKLIGKCRRRSAEKMKVVVEGLLFPTEERRRKSG